MKKLFLALKLNKIRKQMNLDKLKKTELWVAALSALLISILTQADVDPVLAEKVTLSIAGIASTYILGRSAAKFGKDQS